MQTSEILGAWWKILKGQPPSLSIEITKECPLRCPGCYAYEDHHVGGAGSLRQLHDLKGDALVNGVLEIVDRVRPLHLSLVGGDPLVRYRECEALVPQILDRGIHLQIVTSAFRRPSIAWANLRRLTLVVSVDGLEPDHNERRAPATYERILKNIAGHQVTVHCTITAGMMREPGYLARFTEFWTARAEVKRIWFSMFTPQRGAELPEILSAGERAQAIADLLALRRAYPKIDMHESLIREFATPPSSPEECIFARTTQTISADLRTRIAPCQFGGDPDCAQCGCVASMGLAAIGRHRIGGLVPVRAIFRASTTIGSWNAPARPVQSPFTVLPHRPEVEDAPRRRIA